MSNSILVLEDKEETIAYFLLLLEDAGYKIIHAETVSEAIDLVKNHELCFLIVDWRVPIKKGQAKYEDEDGALKFLDFLESEGNILNRGVPFMVLTGERSIVDKVRCERIANFRGSYNKLMILGSIDHVLKLISSR